MASELEVLIDQLAEMLGEWPSEPDDAIELASVAGLAARLGAAAEDLEEVNAWRDEDGGGLLDAGWEDVDIDEAVTSIEALCHDAVVDESVEEAMFEFDDLVAGALWSGHATMVRADARRVAQLVRDMPDVFKSLADFASDMMRLPAVAQDLDTYEYWLAIAQSNQK